MEPAYRYRAHVTDVHDGDTFTADVDLGFGVHVYDAKIRVKGLFSPELWNPGGKEARKAAEDMIFGAQVVIETEKTKTQSDVRSFIRYVATVTLANGTNFAEAMIAAGHGTDRP